MKSTMMRWGIALTVIGSLLASGFALAEEAEESKEDCAENQGICGCSYGRILCCDGSYAPRHYEKDGRLIQNACTHTVTYPNANTTHPKNARFLAPSQEMYWKGTIFDR